MDMLIYSLGINPGRKTWVVNVFDSFWNIENCKNTEFQNVPRMQRFQFRTVCSWIWDLCWEFSKYTNTKKPRLIPREYSTQISVSYGSFHRRQAIILYIHISLVTCCYTYIYTYTNPYVYIHTYAYIYIHVHIYVYIHISIYIYIHMYTTFGIEWKLPHNIHLHMSLGLCAITCTSRCHRRRTSPMPPYTRQATMLYTHIYIHIYIRIHIHLYIYMYI